jgi:hypothetical protein
MADLKYLRTLPERAAAGAITMQVERAGGTHPAALRIRKAEPDCRPRSCGASPHPEPILQTG